MHDLVKCPLCYGEKQVFRVRGAKAEIVNFIRRIEVRKDAPGNLPCPFCQATGQVTVEIDAAFRLLFPNDPQIISRAELEELQCQIW